MRSTPPKVGPFAKFFISKWADFWWLVRSTPPKIGPFAKQIGRNSADRRKVVTLRRKVMGVHIRETWSGGTWPALGFGGLVTGGLVVCYKLKLFI